MTDDDMIPAAADFLDKMLLLEADFLDRWAGDTPNKARGAALLGLYCFFADSSAGREQFLKNLAAYKVNPEIEKRVWDKLEEGVSNDIH